MKSSHSRRWYKKRGEVPKHFSSMVGWSFTDRRRRLDRQEWGHVRNNCRTVCHDVARVNAVELRALSHVLSDTAVDASAAASEADAIQVVIRDGRGRLALRGWDHDTVGH